MCLVCAHTHENLHTVTHCTFMVWSLDPCILDRDHEAIFSREFGTLEYVWCARGTWWTDQQGLEHTWSLASAVFMATGRVLRDSTYFMNPVLSSSMFCSQTRENVTRGIYGIKTSCAAVYESVGNAHHGNEIGLEKPAHAPS